MKAPRQGALPRDLHAGWRDPADWGDSGRAAHLRTS